MIEIEEFLRKSSKGNYRKLSLLDAKNIPDSSKIEVLDEWKLKFINQSALKFKCLQQTGDFVDYVQLLDPPEIEASDDLTWLIFFDEQLSLAMGNPFNSPFNPCGVLQHLKIELNVMFMKRLDSFFKKLKGKFNKGVGLKYKLMRSKLMFMQKYFAFQIAASTEMQSKVAIQFSRSNLMKDGLKQNLALEGNLFKLSREKRTYKEIQLLKTRF